LRTFEHRSFARLEAKHHVSLKLRETNVRFIGMHPVKQVKPVEVVFFVAEAREFFKAPDQCVPTRAAGRKPCNGGLPKPPLPESEK